MDSIVYVGEHDNIFTKNLNAIQMRKENVTRGLNNGRKQAIFWPRSSTFFT